MSSDPAHGAGLLARGRTQARRLGALIANLEIDLAICTRFLRTRETVELALQHRAVPLLVEPDLDEINSGNFDGAPIRAYWAWRERQPANARFPGGESFGRGGGPLCLGAGAALARSEPVTLVVVHEHALRHVVEATGGVGTSSRAGRTIVNALPYLCDENAIRRAAECLGALGAITGNR